MRVNLSVAVVAMTTNHSIVTENGTDTSIAEFNWSSSTQGLVLSSFFYGYITTQILGGWFATRFGGKNIYGVGVLVTALFTVLTPWLGVTYPAMHSVWGRWAPPLERSKLATMAIAGGTFGTVVSLPLCGIAAELWGWPSIFYIPGVLGLLWSFVWISTVGNAPSTDKFVTSSERAYIESTIGKKQSEKLAVPWKEILTSVPVWAIVIANFSENWGFYTLITELPTYMNDIFHFSMHNTGMISALPYLTMSITIPLGGLIADWLRKHAIITTTQVRRIFNCFAFFCQAVFLLVVAHSTSPVVVIVCLTMALGFGGLSLTGYAVNHLDIGHEYAGILYGISNTAGTLPGILSPTITGFLVENKTAEDWKTVFYISVAIYSIGGIAYWYMASGETQPWSKTTKENTLMTQQSRPAIKLSKQIHNI
ncbi:hypothetical protein AAG570_008622 [Ranatra chinensis]|uniref:Major facilitator superfamily (MFS) profile domain-containing protein n=1 Tax=Ranatra chinensis TaxID=642074 RepID=A0ABD0YTL1_9HEMI